MANSTVIIVPGITGSSLLWPFGPSWLATVWLSPPALLAGGFSAMRLAIPSESKPGPNIGTNRRGGALLYYYGPLAAALTSQGWLPTWTEFDWRRPLAQDAELLAAFIRVRGRAGPLKIVCHSRGGLVTRKALGILGPTDGPPLVSRVVGMGVPHTGSLNAAAQISGDNGGLKLTRELASIFPGNLVTTYVHTLITEVSRSWPALYELLPAPGNGWFDAAQTAALYLPATWAASATTPVSQYLTDALANWTALPAVPSWVDWVDVAASVLPTANGIESLEDLAVNGRLAYGGSGDGVVPFASAHQSGRRVLTVPTGHGSLPIDPRVMQGVADILANGLAADAAITGRVLDI